MLMFIVCSVIGIVSPFIIRRGVREGDLRTVLIGVVLLVASSVLPFVSFGGADRAQPSLGGALPVLPKTSDPEEMARFTNQLSDVLQAQVRQKQ